MEWKEFTESPKEYPEKIAEASIEGFGKATKGLVEMTITPADELGFISSYLDNDFQFNVHLRSQHVKSYRLKVLTLGYNVELAPIHLAIEESIFENVFQRKMWYKEKVIAKDVIELKTILTKIFESQRFIDIVTGVMKIAKKNIQSNSQTSK